MKRSIIFTCLAVLALFACRKNDNPKIPDPVRVPTPLITKAAGSDQDITAQTPGGFVGKIVVDLYFKTDVPPQKFDLVVMKNTNKNVVKVVKSDITTFPTTVELTGAQLASLFGTPVVLSDKFDIGADVTTQSGQRFEAFPAIGNGYGAGVANQVGASLTVQYLVK